MSFEKFEHFEKGEVVPGVVPESEPETTEPEPEATREPVEEESTDTPKVVGYENMTGDGAEDSEKTSQKQPVEKVDVSPEGLAALKATAQKKVEQAKKTGIVFASPIKDAGPDLSELQSDGSDKRSDTQRSYQDLIEVIETLQNGGAEEGVDPQALIQHRQEKFEADYKVLINLKDSVLQKARQLGIDIKDPLADTAESETSESEEDTEHEFAPDNWATQTPEAVAAASELDLAIAGDDSTSNKKAPGNLFEQIPKPAPDPEKETLAKDLEAEITPSVTHSYSLGEIVLQNPDSKLETLTVSSVEVELVDCDKRPTSEVEMYTHRVMKQLRDARELVKLREEGKLEAEVVERLNRLYKESEITEPVTIGSVVIGELRMESLTEPEPEPEPEADDTEEIEPPHETTAEPVVEEKPEDEPVADTTEKTHEEEVVETVVATPPPLLESAESDEPRNGFETHGGPVTEVLNEVLESELSDEPDASKAMIIERMASIVTANPEAFGLTLEDSGDMVTPGTVADKGALEELFAGVRSNLGT